MLMLGKKKKRKVSKRMLGDLSYDEASAIVGNMAASLEDELGRRIDFECYDCEEEDDLGFPLVDDSFDDDDDHDDDDDDDGKGSERESDDEREDALDRCDKFLDAVYVKPQSGDELAINEIAVKQTVLPAMERLASDLRASHGGLLDPEDHGMQIVLAGLEAIAPGCGWAYHEDESAWTYAYGEPVQGHHIDILDSMFPLAVKTIEKINDVRQANDG
jgi:hypothetical protein